MSSLGLLEDKSKEKKWEKILSPNQKLIIWHYNSIQSNGIDGPELKYNVLHHIIFHCQGLEKYYNEI